MINKISDLVMTADQENLFHKKTREKTGKYFWMANAFVLLFQIYNILYTLHYTNFRLGSQASKVYMGLYVSMLLICIVSGIMGFIWTYTKKEHYTRLLCLYTVFSCLLLLWSVCVTLYDQRISNNISVYMTTAIYVAGLIYIRPHISIPVFILCEVLLVTGVSWLQYGNFRDDYGFFINSVGLTIVALFISLYRWGSLRRDFLNQLEMEQKNRMITEQSEKLNYIANHDALTGLWNRNHLNEWKESFFSGSQHQAVVFIIDIDHFKEYNDAFGHVAGNECLKKVANALQELEGIFFRFGGEEFLCLLTNEAVFHAPSLADKLCRHIEKQQIASAQPGKSLTISAGYSAGTMKNDLEFRRLLHEADEALYCAKNNGRNQVVDYSTLKS